jgi:hypothetical protein
MKVLQTLRPGKPGTRTLTSRYGDRLLAVRDRMDPDRGVRCTTVELIVDEAPLLRPARQLRTRPPRVDPNPMVGVRIFFRESEVRERAKAAVAIWRSRHKLWEMDWRIANLLGLADRVVCGHPEADAAPEDAPPSTPAEKSRPP